MGLVSLEFIFEKFGSTHTHTQKKREKREKQKYTKKTKNKIQSRQATRRAKM